MESTERAWLAGIWDGEGTISLYARSIKPPSPSTRHRRNYEYEPKRYLPLMAVVNSHFPLGERIHQMLTEMEVVHYFLRKVRSRSSFSQREMWTIHIHGMQPAKRLLAELWPYLFVKRDEAEQLQRWITIAESRDNHLSYTEEQHAIARSLRKRVTWRSAAKLDRDESIG